MRDMLPYRYIESPSEPGGYLVCRRTQRPAQLLPPGDPVKNAAFIYRIGLGEQLPLHLPVGQDALHRPS
jgi:hypothetical protein